MVIIKVTLVNGGGITVECIPMEMRIHIPAVAKVHLFHQNTPLAHKDYLSLSFTIFIPFSIYFILGGMPNGTPIDKCESCYAIPVLAKESLGYYSPNRGAEI